MNHLIGRRSALYGLSGMVGLPFCQIRSGVLNYPYKIKIGACDWSIGQHSEVKSLAVGQEIGLDGVQVSLGKAENNMHLRQVEIQKAYKQAAKRYGVKIASLAIGELNKYPYKSDQQTIKWVEDSIQVAKDMKCKVILLAFFGKGDLKNDDIGQREVVQRLKNVMTEAEKLGITLGIESWLSASEHMKIIDAVGSSNLKVYYDVANSEKMGYDIYEEIRWLGAQICEIHMKENGALLGQGRVDFVKVAEAMADIRYSGWVQIEGAVPKGTEMLPSYRQNNAFLRKTFGL